MPRDSSGAYSLPSGTLVNSGDTVLPSQHNPAFQDVASNITGSLSRDGLGGMRADLDAGGYKAINLAPGTADTDAATVGQLSSFTLPVGVEFDWPGATAPTGFLLEYGQAISRTTYAALFAVIGTLYGAGDGSTTFNLPDFRGRGSVGKDDMGGTSAGRLSDYAGTTLGAAFGAQNVVLTADQLAAHSHSVTDPQHSHGLTLPQRGGNNNASSASAAFVTDDPTGNNANATTSSSGTGISIANAGADGAHPNVQPSTVRNKIIYTGVS